MYLLERLFRYRWTLVVLLLAALPVSIVGAVRAWHSNSNNIADWMPADFDATQKLMRFVELFGSDELLMISWPGCTLDDPRIKPYGEALLQRAAARPDVEPYFRLAITGPQVYEFFREPPLEFSRQRALSRMRGWILSSDEQHTCLIALVSATGAADRHAAVAHVFDTADRVPGLSADTIHVAGPTLEGVAIDQASQEHLLQLNLVSFAVCLLVMVVCLRNIRAALLVFLIALFNEQLTMALIHYCGSNMDSVLLLTANLTFVLTVSAGIHLVNYYRDVLPMTSPERAPLQALRVALKPTALATLTTSLGLVSLTASQVKPLIRFGGYSAVAIIMAGAVTMVYITLHFLFWPLASRALPAQPEAQPVAHNGRWLRFLRLARWPLMVVVLTIFVGGFLGVQRLRTSVGLKELLADDTRVIRDYHWLESNVGPLTPLEIVLTMPAGDARATVAQLRTVFLLHGALAEVDRSNAVISAANFSNEPPLAKGGVRQVARAATFRQRLMDSLPQLRASGYLRTENDHNYWRITVRVPAMRETGFGPLLDRIQSVVDKTLCSADAVPTQDVIICGGVPLVYQVQEQLLRDLINSFMLAFALVCLTLVVLFRSVACGLICMIPNVLPTALVFGVMGWRGTPVEIGAILTASAALGIAVDDSLHFITWFRRKIADGGTIAEAVPYAYRRCAAAMLQTTLICSLGLVVFAASSFTPMVRFGWCMFWLLVVALVGDLVVLPAILLSPLGRPFLPRGTRPIVTLHDFAYRVAGPRDAVINFAINAPIAVAVYYGLDSVPLVGVPSLLIICAPMCFLLPAITTCFGYWNGVVQRSTGRLPPAWSPVHRWARQAVLCGLMRGMVTCGMCTLSLVAVNWFWPGLVLPKWIAVAIVGILAAALGFQFHATAVTRTAKLGQQPSVCGTPESGTQG